MDLNEADWKKLEKELTTKDLLFISSIREGMDLETAFKEAHPGGTRTEALARFAFLYSKYEPLFSKCKDQIGALCEFIALDDVRAQLASEAPKVCDQGIKNIRAMRGMDAPKQIEARVNPFLDERPLGPVGTEPMQD